MQVYRLRFVACLFVLFAAAAIAGQKIETSTSDRAAVPYIGERLVYKIEWDPPWYFFFLPTLDAGEAVVELVGEVDYNNRKALRIQFRAHSSGAMVKMSGLKIEDEYTFLADPETFCTLSASETIREGKRKRQIDVQYLRETRQLHIREVDEAAAPTRVKKDETRSDIPECVHDPLSALYLFRQTTLRENFSSTFVLANDDKIREVRSVVEKQEIIQTSSGKAAVWRINTAALMGGLFKEGGQFKIWLSEDAKKVPIQFEVKVRLGRIFGKLKTSQ
jgi:hypothetical protein